MDTKHLVLGAAAIAGLYLATRKSEEEEEEVLTLEGLAEQKEAQGLVTPRLVESGVYEPCEGAKVYYSVYEAENPVDGKIWYDGRFQATRDGKSKDGVVGLHSSVDATVSTLEKLSESRICPKRAPTVSEIVESGTFAIELEKLDGDGTGREGIVYVDYEIHKVLKTKRKWGEFSIRVGSGKPMAEGRTAKFRKRDKVWERIYSKARETIERELWTGF